MGLVHTMAQQPHSAQVKFHQHLQELWRKLQQDQQFPGLHQVASRSGANAPQGFLTLKVLTAVCKCSAVRKCSAVCKCSALKTLHVMQ